MARFLITTERKSLLEYFGLSCKNLVSRGHLLNVQLLLPVCLIRGVFFYYLFYCVSLYLCSPFKKIYKKKAWREDLCKSPMWMQWICLDLDSSVIANFITKYQSQWAFSFQLIGTWLVHHTQMERNKIAFLLRVEFWQFIKILVNCSHHHHLLIGALSYFMNLNLKFIFHLEPWVCLNVLQMVTP